MKVVVVGILLMLLFTTIPQVISNQSIINKNFEPIGSFNRDNSSPIFGNPNPANGSTDQSLSFTWEIPINDTDGDVFDWNIDCSNGQTNNATGDTNGTKTLSLTGLSFSTTYTVWVNATDPGGSGNYTREWYIFTTKANSPPNTPSNPSPANGATGVDIDADLSWTCSDPDGDSLTYDVYFGTSSPPPLISSGQSANTYDPGTMNFGTTYYWQIVAEDVYGASTSGPIWSFTTRINNQPYIPSNPIPADGSTNLAVIIDLSWTGGDPDQGDIVTYDVYLGTSSPPQKVATNHTTTTYDPGTLEYNTLYYWQIVAWDNHGASTPGPIWEFTTEEEVNRAPIRPLISGPQFLLLPGFEYEYQFISSDPEGDDLFYYVDWGDGTFEDWEGPHTSGENISIIHTWPVGMRIYEIRAKAKDIYGAESDYGTLTVIVLKLSRESSPLFVRIFERIIDRFQIFERIFSILFLLKNKLPT